MALIGRENDTSFHDVVLGGDILFDNYEIGETNPKPGDLFIDNNGTRLLTMNATTNTFEQDLITNGDFTVNGDTTFLNTTNLEVEDPLTYIASANTADTLDTGYYAKYNDGSDRYTGIFRDASAEAYRIFDNLTVLPTTTVDTGDGSYNELFTVLASGNVGIGSTNPSQILDVGMSNLDIINFTGSGASDRVHVNLANSASAMEIGICGGANDFFTGTADGDAIVRAADQDLYMGTIGANDLKLYTNDTLRMTVNSSGIDVVGDINTSTDYNIASTQVLSATTLGGAVVNSSLTNVGTLTALSVSAEIGCDGVDVTTGNDYQINNVSVLNSTNLGGAVVNSSLQNLGIQDADLNMGTNDITNATSITATNLTGTLQTATQPNITSVGTLSALSVVGNTTLDGDVTLADGILHFIDADTRITGDGGNLMDFFTANTRRMRMHGTGNISMGTTSDFATLFLQRAADQIIRVDAFDGSSFSALQLLVDANTTASGTDLATAGAANDFTTGSAHGDSILRNTHSTGRLLFANTSTNTAMSIENNAEIRSQNNSFHNSTGGSANIIAGDVPYARYEKNGTHTISNTTQTAITSWTETTDRGGFSVSGSTFTLPVVGLYKIDYQIVYVANATGVRVVGLMNNTTFSFNASNSIPGYTGFTNFINGSCTINHTNASHTYGLQTWQNSGGVLNVSAGIDTHIIFTRIGNDV